MANEKKTASTISTRDRDDGPWFEPEDSAGPGWQWRNTFEPVADTVRLRALIEPPDSLSLMPEERGRAEGIDPYDHLPDRPLI